MRRFILLSLSLFGALLALPIGGGTACAQEIRLTDETVLRGEVLRVTDDGVVLQMPREAVKSVDGVALPPVLLVGDEAPAFAVTDLTGQPQTVGPHASPHALTVLHFWVSWCPFCQQDAPEVQKLHDQYRDGKSVRVVTVSLDQKRGDLDTFLRTHAVTYPVIDAQEQAQAAGVDLPELYQITGFPVTYLIDRAGRVVEKIPGSFVAGGMDLDALVHQHLSSS